MHVFSLEREQECNPKHHVEKAAHASAARRMNRPTQLHRRLKIRGGPEVGECHWTQVNGEMVPGAEPHIAAKSLCYMIFLCSVFGDASNDASSLVGLGGHFRSSRNSDTGSTPVTKR